MLQDFSFRSPEELLADLSAAGGMGHMGGMGGMGGMMANDVEYDAFLANDRTLADPQVIRTEAGGAVLLRIINAASTTAFWIDLGETVGTIVAVDGNPVVPITAHAFPIAAAQRADVMLTVPAGGVVPVLAQREEDRARTGIMLAAPGAQVAKIAEVAGSVAPTVAFQLELQLAAAHPLADKTVGTSLRVQLSGGMMSYVWGIDGRTWNDHAPLAVTAGERVVFAIENHSMMAHPMHLHGHHFQVIGINGQPLAGAMRDTVLVPPMNWLETAFDADNPGRWLFHCHNLYHMATGMMTEVTYG